MLEFVDSVFILFKNPLLQVGSGSNEKVPDPDYEGRKPTDPTGSSSLGETTIYNNINNNNNSIICMLY